MKKKNITKYNFEWTPKVCSEFTLTVPDLVLSMAEIYRKYAITGDISSLPGKARPNYVDDGDEFDDSFESEEMTDSLLYARDIRESVRTRQPDDRSVSGDKPLNAGVEESGEDSSAKPQEPDAKPEDTPDGES